MLIDWFTVAAQIVNFVVLLALLKRFLYKPLLKAIDDREQRIAARLTEADRRNQEAELQMQHAIAKTSEVDRERVRLIAEAQAEADQQRTKMVQKARDSVRALETKWHEDLDRERNAFLDEIRRRVSGEIVAITRKTLADLACADLEQCAVGAFLEELRKFDPAALRSMLGGDLTVVSSTDLPQQIRHEIAAALESRLGAPVDVSFQRSSNLAWGVELRGHGQRIGWTSDRYLDSLEDRLKSTLDQVSQEARPLVPG